PGHVRELCNTVQRAALLWEGTRIAAQALGLPEPVAAVADSPPASGSLLDLDLRARECQLIFDTLRATAGSRKRAAEQLGISARTLRHKLQQFRAAGIEIPGRGACARSVP
ncbi:MAG: sigma-54-dependent Fis family transcriptional regulator, partial [Proteobacteria bacterium]|nr:sigma-54-dependent Fis family transcriptional regulator [Pseudomonadota bacterium]